MTGIANAATESTELIFLSHSGADTEAAKNLAGLLRQGGVDVWLDVERLAPGDVWTDQIEAALVTTKHFIVYIGPSGVRNWVGREVRFALDRSTQDRSFRLIPVLGPGADAEALPLFLKQHQWLDLRSGDIPPQQLKQLLQALSGRELMETSLLGPNQSPFRGLFAFEEEDAFLFFGRDKETEQLVKKLALDRFLAVVGDSGSGKSSLVKAGLVPALHGGRLSLATGEIASWRVCVARPGDPFRELAEGLAQLDSGLSAAERTAFVAEAKKQMATGAEGLRNAIAGLRIPRTTRVLVVIDQFEELFTTDTGKDEQLRYIDTLLAAVPTETDRRIHVVITLRADFYSQCWVHPELPKRIGANQFPIQRMDRAHLQEAIEKPLAMAGVRAESGLVEALLNEVGDEPGNLSLLEHALEQLWAARSDGVIRNSSYENMGRLKGSLRNYADQVYERLGSDERRLIARTILVRLTQLGEGAQDTRRRSSKADVLAAAGNPSDAENVLNRLASARILTVGVQSLETDTAEGAAEHPDTQREVVEMAHEALIREWPLLREWLSEDRQDLRVERTILDAALEWSESFGRSDEALLQGARLAQAEEWFARHQYGLGDKARQFLVASLTKREEAIETERRHKEEKEAAARERERRDRRLASAVTFLLIVGAAVGWWAQRQIAMVESEQLASRALQETGVSPESSLALAIQAARRFQSEQSQVALDAALNAAHARIIMHHDAAVLHAAFSPTGAEVTTVGRDQTARVWNSVTGKALGRYEDPQGAIAWAAFSNDGDRLLTVNLNHTARVWDLATGLLLSSIDGAATNARLEVFSPDGKRVATIGDDGVARMWDARTGTGLFVLRESEGANALAFSPNGGRLATGGGDGKVRVWDTNGGHIQTTLPVNVGPINSVLFSPDGTKVIAASDSTARILDAAGGATIVLTGHHAPIGRVEFSANGRRVLTASGDGFVEVSAADTGRTLAAMAGDPDNTHSAALSPDGQYAVTEDRDHAVRIRDVGTGRILAALTGHHSAVLDIEFSPDGQRVLTASADGTARLWDLEAARAAKAFGGTAGSVAIAVFSPDGNHILTAHSGGATRIWNSAGDRIEAVLSGHTGSVNAVAFSPDGNRVVTASDDGTARVWDASSGRMLTLLSGHTGPVKSACFSLDGTRVLTLGSDRTARLWDAATGSGFATLYGEAGGVNSAVFSRDGNDIATGHFDGTARLWDAERGTQLKVLRGHKDAVNSVAFSPDGKEIITASDDNTSRVWSVTQGSTRLVLIGHRGRLSEAVFSPDGKWAATASADRTAIVWNLAYGSIQMELKGHGAAVQDVSFSPGSDRILTTSEDGTVRVWDFRSGVALETLGEGLDVVRTAVYSPDGATVLTSGGMARIYPVSFPRPAEMGGAAETCGCPIIL